ncbi:hypothetical protein A5735_09260 [Mycolicibacter heraklionensis]|nr:hypothetical protein A5735_09260 [Mycolicibacter heraklionensis]
MASVVDAAVVAALSTSAYALWARRHTWGSPWDTNPTCVLVFLGCAGLLMSPVGPTLLDPLFHRMLGLWNVAGLLAVLCVFGAVVAMFDHLVMRLADENHARLLKRRHVTAPLKLGLPLVLIVFCIADRGQPQYLDLFAPRGPWFAAYWALVGALGLHVFGLTGRVLLVLRSDPRSTASTERYLVWVGLNAATILAQLIGVVAGTTVTWPSWICAGASAITFAYASVLSWRDRTTWFGPTIPRTAAD